ncbi:hypothetical protein CP10139811_0983 [Chlamydia ibidis]|uniref:Uncharacterized protein n=2 Tax=Chlamydia ibidis TaxID=1405396 RepID=S7J553_9CHLA|nr:hypothetical protein CP10139811_0983 [Chlamydia ibidis]EQM63116.1 hypothetical protein H359_0301 [Chlamydia ibidis 10-1398/6]
MPNHGTLGASTSEEESQFTAFLARSKERFFQQKKFLRYRNLSKL